MRKVFFTLGFILFLLPLHAEDPPSSEPRPPLPPPPTIIRIEIQREIVEKLTAPEEDEAYFGNVEGRFERERIVIVRQTRLSIEKSTEDGLVIYLLTVYDSTGECYGLCKPAEPLPQEKPRTFWHIVPIEREPTNATLTGGFFCVSREVLVSSSLR